MAGAGAASSLQVPSPALGTVSRIPQTSPTPGDASSPFVRVSREAMALTFDLTSQAFSANIVQQWKPVGGYIRAAAIDASGSFWLGGNDNNVYQIQGQQLSKYSAEQGLPGFDSRGLFGLLAPAGTPNDVIQLLNREIAAVLREPPLHAGGVEKRNAGPVLHRAITPNDASRSHVATM